MKRRYSSLTSVRSMRKSAISVARAEDRLLTLLHLVEPPELEVSARDRTHSRFDLGKRPEPDRDDVGRAAIDEEARDLRVCAVVALDDDPRVARRDRDAVERQRADRTPARRARR
jgi:hypothetical protein